MSNTTFSASIRLHTPQQQPLPGLQVQLWLDQQGQDEQLATGQTDAQGICRLSFELQVDKRKTSPPFAYVYVHIYERGVLVHGRPEGAGYPIIDTETNIQITLEKPVRVRPVDRIPFDRSTLLRLDLRNTAALTESQRSFVRSKLNDALLEGIRRQLSEADARLAGALNGLMLDYRKFQEKTMGEVWKEAVLPFLQKNPETWKFWEELRLGSVENDKRKVYDVLRLDAPVAKNPLFREESRIVRTAALGTALGLSNDLTDTLAGLPLDLERASEADWQKLVDDKVVSAAEKTTLQRGFAFSRLTGGNAALAANLHKTVTEVRNIVRFEAPDWLALIKTAGNETPNGETPEEYAANLLRVAQRSFPSAFLLERKVRKSTANQADLLAELRKVQPVATKSARAARGVAPAPLSLENSPKLRAAANTYRYLGAQEILTDPNLSPEGKVEHLAVRQAHLKMFLEKNEGLDLRTADFFAKNEDGSRLHDYTGIPEENQANVRQQMMSFQRTLRLGTTYEAQDALLSAGLDTSHSIVQKKTSQIGALLGNAVNPATINQVIATAQAQYQQMVQATLSFQGIESSNYFGLQVLNYPEELRNHLQGIDGYAQMFGDQNFCECDHCKSIFGPAAYFVDLMRFVDQNVELADANILSDADRDKHPISLAVRRPDLWYLELTCENTNRPVPYLWLVNKIKITYLCKVLGIWSNTKNFEQNAAALWAELARLPLASGGNSGSNALPQAARLGVMTPQTGTTWKNSFRVAFNRPFEESLILLEALGVRYGDLLAAFKVTAPYRREAAYLGLSEEEWNILTTEDTYLNDLVELRFAFPYEKPYPNEPDYFELAKCNVQAFQRATSLNREDTETLLALPALHAVSAAVRLVREAVANEIQQYREWIEGLNDVRVLDFIHRFLRLWRHLPGWSLRELDLAVQRVGVLDPAGVAEISRIYTLQRELKMSFEEALAMQGDIPNARIYTRMVRNEFLNLSVEEAVPGMLQRLFDPEKIYIQANPQPPTNMDVATLTTNGKLPYLLKGLGVTQADYERTYSLLFGTATVVLNLKNVSDCYRFIRLARALGVSVEALGYWLKLDNNSVAFNTARILEVARLAGKVKAMPLSLHEMWFVANGDSAENSQIRSAYVGLNESGVALAKVAATTWTDAFFANKALYITTETLKGFLPAGLQETKISDFITALRVANIVLVPLTDSDTECRVLRRSTPYLLADIPEKCNLGFKNDPLTGLSVEIVVEENARKALADHLNKNYILDADGTYAQTRIVHEQLGVLLNINAQAIENLTLWSDQFAGVLTEIENNWTTPGGYHFTALQNALPELERVVTFLTKLNLDTDDLAFVNAHYTQFSSLTTGDYLSRIKNLDDFGRFTNYLRFKTQAMEVGVNLVDFRIALQGKTNWYTTPALIATVANLAGCESGQLQAIGQLLPVAALSAATPDALAELAAAAGILKMLGIYDKTTLTSIKECDFANASQYEQPLRAAFRARYATEEDFEKAWEPYENRINELRRDVLCAFLLALDRDSQFKTTSDLYAYFLVDVEMSGCARVSEILAATLSLQLYVHRVIMGLEASTVLQPQQNTGSNQSVTPFPAVRAYLGQPDLNSSDAIDTDTQSIVRKQWEWRKNYRIWEANRKVFLYPENWIEPELRDDKSPLFKTLEDELLQQKISLESAEVAYKEYLKGFAEVGELAIAGAVFNESYLDPCHYIFGRSGSDPYIYYYRKMRMIGSGTEDVAYSWQPWQKIELSISSPEVSPLIFRNQLHVFWVEVQSEELSKFEVGNSIFDGTRHKINLLYSKINENGKWLQPQRIDFHDYDTKMDNYQDYRYEVNHLMKDGELARADPYQKKYESRDYYFKSRFYKKLYATFDQWEGDLVRLVYNRAWLGLSDATLTSAIVRSINFSNNKLSNGERNWLYSYYLKVLPYNASTKKRILQYHVSPEEEVVLDYHHDKTGMGSSDWALVDISAVEYQDCIMVNRSFNHSDLRLSNDLILKLKNEHLLLHKRFLAAGGYRFALLKLNTNTIPAMLKTLFQSGLEEFLTPQTQKTRDASIPATALNYTDIEMPPSDRLNFNGSLGLYFRELFFHIPFLIADHLNAEGKYKEADYWYRKIFDPSADYDNNLANPTDRYWRYLEFREQTFPQLKEMLGNKATIAVHENDPFNPHAIARLRIGAYMKNIVMKYVDNLLDWADSLFRRDTWESNTEALMLYMLAKDILGDRPEKLGKCESAVAEKNCSCAHPVNYAALKEHEDFGDSPFVYYVENWVLNLQSANGNGVLLPDGAVVQGGLNGAFNVVEYETVAQTPQAANSNTSRQSREVGQPGVFTGVAGKASNDVFTSMGWQMYRREGEKLVFCIPNNENMLAYWDRVDDRLFKLRHCMNIDGVKRSLALFQPPIDPALLVAAFAAGLSIDDVLNNLYGDLPAYRFSYLVEKAKMFAGTVQGFGSALLGALEKKDGEALTLLRSTQEQNILKMTKEVKKKAVEEAKANLQSAVEGMMNVVNRQMHYLGLIETGLTTWETTQQIALHTTSVLHGIESVFGIVASLTSLIPNVGAPTSMNYGGVQISGSMAKYATVLNALASLSSAISASAGLEASNQRRAQDWNFQAKLAEQELKQVQQQIVAATIRLAIAEKDLEIHEKQIEQAAELHDFYKNKFTGLGLYTYMASTLQRLHRLAYNTALDMAKQAEAAYKFETGDDTYTGISGGAFWDASRVGLLSGEQLTHELQQLETNFINWNRRQMEIRQSFSMRMIDPQALLDLQKQGKCTFVIPEWAFDMQYAGHYRRRIVSAQITIPCVAGPYTNVAATLTLTKGSLRKDSIADGYGNKTQADGFLFRGSGMIATSNASNDGGQFDLNFRDERFLPFEGAGAVDSEWVLELPTKFPSFDYATISDVIFHLSYRSKYDGGQFKTDAKDGLAAAMGTMQRLISLKQEFPDALFQLQTGTNLPVELELDNRHLPAFANAPSSFVVKARTASNSNWGSAITKGSTGKYTVALTPQSGEDVYVMIEYML